MSKLLHKNIDGLSGDIKNRNETLKNATGSATQHLIQLSDLDDDEEEVFVTKKSSESCDESFKSSSCTISSQYGYRTKNSEEDNLNSSLSSEFSRDSSYVFPCDDGAFSDTGSIDNYLPWSRSQSAPPDNPSFSGAPKQSSRQWHSASEQNTTNCLNTAQESNSDSPSFYKNNTITSSSCTAAASLVIIDYPPRTTSNTVNSTSCIDSASSTSSLQSTHSTGKHENSPPDAGYKSGSSEDCRSQFSLRSTTRRERFILVILGVVEMSSAMSLSIMAPFFPDEVSS